MSETKHDQNETRTDAQTYTRPVRVFRAFGVKVSIFANRIKNGAEESLFHKVTVQRIYRDGESFKATHGLARQDLPAAWLLLQKAWDYIAQAESGRGTKDAMA